MAKTKAAKKVKVKIVVFFDKEGHYAACGEWFAYDQKKPSNDTLLAESDNIGAEDLPHAAIVDVELEMPQPPRAKVLKVKAVKR